MSFKGNQLNNLQSAVLQPWVHDSGDYLSVEEFFVAKGRSEKRQALFPQHNRFTEILGARNHKKRPLELQAALESTF